MVQRIARTYELQALFDENQRDTVDLIAGGGPGGASTRTTAALQSRLRVILQLEAGLQEGYALALTHLRDAEGPRREEAGS